MTVSSPPPRVSPRRRRPPALALLLAGSALVLWPALPGLAQDSGSTGGTSTGGSTGGAATPAQPAAPAGYNADYAYDPTYGLTPAQAAAVAAQAQAQAQAQQGIAVPQSNVPPRLSLQVDTTLRSTENLDLDPQSQGQTTSLGSDLLLAWREQTGITSFALDLGATLRYADGATTSSDGFRDPFVSLSWIRATKASSLDVSLGYSSSDLATLRRSAIDVTNPTVDTITSTGTRNRTSLAVTGQYRLDAPLGYMLGYSYDDVNYTGDSNSTDNTRHRLKAGLRADFDAITQGHATLGYSYFQSDDPDEDGNTTPSLELGLDRLQSRGKITTLLRYDDRPGGAVTTLTFGRSLQRPNSAIQWTLGSSFDDGNVDLVGSVGWNQTLRSGSLSLAFNRAIGTNDADQNELQTGLRAGYSHTLTARDQLALSVGYAESQLSGSGGGTAYDGYLTASWNRALTADWGMNVGYEHRISKDTDTSEASSDSIFVGLSRTFVLLP